MAKQILSGIYQINGPTGKFYVGSAAHIPRRWIEHKRDLRKGDHANAKLQCAWNKHGELAFTIQILEVVTDVHRLIEREQHWLDATNAASVGYNILPTAGSNLGRKTSSETKKKMSDAQKGRKHGPMREEQKRYFSELYKGKRLSEETRQRMSASRTGRKFSEESRKKMSDAAKGRAKSEAHKIKIAEVRTGSKASDETRAKMREAQSNRKPISEETRQRLRLAQQKLAVLRKLHGTQKGISLT